MPGRLAHLIFFVLQAGLTLLMLMLLYMSLVIFDADSGMKGLAALLFLQPLQALLFSLITILVCTLAGLFIRLNRRAFAWWTKYFYLSLLLIIAGFILVLAGTGPLAQEVLVAGESGLRSRVLPDTTVFLSGWFLLAFGMLHLFPPRFILEWAGRMSDRIRYIRSIYRNRPGGS